MQEVLPGEAPESAQGQEPDALSRLRLGPDRSLFLSLLIAVLAGGALSLSLPPADVGPLAFVALAPLLWLVREARPRRGFLLGFAFGLTYFGATLYWILLFGELAWFALVTLSAAFVGVFAMLAPIVWRRSHRVLSALGIAALWTAIEWVRGMFPLGGFTWGDLSTTQAGNRLLLPLASVAGAWGITFVVAAVNAFVLSAAERWSRPSAAFRPLLAGAFMVMAPALIPLPAPNGRMMDVATIQVDVRPARTFAAGEEDRAVAGLHVGLHQRLSADPPDLAVWGESSLDPGAATDAGTLDDVTSAIREVGAPTLLSSTRPGPGGGLRRDAVLVGPGGAEVDSYSKVHLVPFGEFVPLRGALDWISALDQVPYDLTPGEGVHALEGSGLPRIGASICYENSFAGIQRELVADGAEVLVVLTNNASYEDTAASDQHLLMSRLRAVELGRWTVHGAISGISGVVDPSGRVVARGELFEPAILRARIRASTARTLYARFGDWAPIASMLFAVAIMAAPRRRRSSRAAPGPLPPSPRTLVVLPTYNERETIEIVIEGLLALRTEVDVLVVDDGSPDGTGELVRGARERDARVRLIERPRKEGLASAYLVGFRAALEGRYDLIAEMDSDLSHQPEELERLLAGAGNHDLVIGSRYVPGGSVTDWSPLRVALSRGGNLYARVALGLPLHDATSGFRVYRRDLLDQLMVASVHSDGYGFQIELALRAYNAGYAVAEVPITFREREHGHSKISRRIVAEALWLVTVWGIRSRLRPDRPPRPTHTPRAASGDMEGESP